MVCAYNGEDYADIPTVQRTVGFIPRATREERENRTLEASDFAAALVPLRKPFELGTQHHGLDRFGRCGALVA